MARISRELGSRETLIISAFCSRMGMRAQWKNSRDLITRKRVCCKQSARFGDVWRHKYLAPISGFPIFPSSRPQQFQLIPPGSVLLVNIQRYLCGPFGGPAPPHHLRNQSDDSLMPSSPRIGVPGWQKFWSS